jgi:hypothetical protein
MVAPRSQAGYQEVMEPLHHGQHLFLLVLEADLLVDMEDEALHTALPAQEVLAVVDMVLAMVLVEEEEEIMVSIDKVKV